MSMQPHLSQETIVAYEAGTLSAGWALAVASHLAFCGHCRGDARLARTAGGAMLEALEPAPLRPGALEQALERAARPAAEIPTAAPRRDSPIPAPLQAFVGADIDAMPWRRLGLTAYQVWIDTGDRSTRTRLLRVRPGESMPVHGHSGAEMTLALVGSVHTSDGVLKPGDIEEAGADTVHQPVAGAESECICLAVTDAPLRFKSVLMLIAQPFLRI
jgi:putative transcriptional regulator